MPKHQPINDFNGGMQRLPELNPARYHYREDLEESKRRRRIEDIKEASRLEREVLGEVWDD